MLKCCFSEKCKTLVGMGSAGGDRTTKEQRLEADGRLLSPKAKEPGDREQKDLGSIPALG